MGLHPVWPSRVECFGSGLAFGTVLWCCLSVFELIAEMFLHEMVGLEMIDVETASLATLQAVSGLPKTRTDNLKSRTIIIL